MPKRQSSKNSNNVNYYTITGVNPISTLLEHDPDRAIKVIVVDNLQSNRIQPLLKTIEQHQIQLERLSREDFNLRYQGVTQGIAAEVLLPKSKTFKDLQRWLTLGVTEDSLLLILDQIQDPHNLGAILRTADAAGVDAVIISDKGTVPLNATVSKVASGGAENVAIYRVPNLMRAIEVIKESGIWLIGTTDHANQSLYDSNFSGSLALVMGSEGTGMRHLTEKSCDFLVKLPMLGVVNSLNVSVATGVCLYEINRQRRLD